MIKILPIILLLSACASMEPRRITSPELFKMAKRNIESRICGDVVDPPEASGNYCIYYNGPVRVDATGALLD